MSLVISQVGLGLSYALTITRTLSFGVRSSTALENQFNSVERVQQFIGLRQEEDEVMGMPRGVSVHGARRRSRFRYRAVDYVMLFFLPCPVSLRVNG